MPGGIVIEKAMYGNLPDGPSADVLEKVKQLVDAGAHPRLRTPALRRLWNPGHCQIAAFLAWPFE